MLVSEVALQIRRAIIITPEPTAGGTDEAGRSQGHLRNRRLRNRSQGRARQGCGQGRGQGGA